MRRQVAFLRFITRQPGTCFSELKKKEKGKVKILPNALLHNAGAKHDDVQQDTTPEKLPPLDIGGVEAAHFGLHQSK